jgi:antitoxin component HigA of HigAB toxin-antitoxin module
LPALLTDFLKRFVDEFGAQVSIPCFQRGEPQLTLTHVRTLAKHFSAAADLFLP